MMAYRVETATANSFREAMSHPDKARTLLCALYKTEEDLPWSGKANIDYSFASFSECNV